jgi:hypothetical protein
MTAAAAAPPKPGFNIAAVLLALLALVPPAILVGVCIFVLPNFVQVLADFGRELPAPARMTISTAAFLARDWPVVMAWSAGLAGALMVVFGLWRSRWIWAARGLFVLVLLIGGAWLESTVLVWMGLLAAAINLAYGLGTWRFRRATVAVGLICLVSFVGSLVVLAVGTVALYIPFVELTESVGANP